MNFFQSPKNGEGLNVRAWVGIKSICLVALFQILLQTSSVYCATSEIFYNPTDSDYYWDEINHQPSNNEYLLNPFDDGSFTNDDGVGEGLLEKRHMGAVAAFQSGSKDNNKFNQRQPLSTKRHLGSIVSSGANKQQKHQILSQLEKRYLGSVASSSKSAFRTNKRHMGAMAKINSKPFKRANEGEMSDSGENYDGSSDSFYDYPVADIIESAGFQSKEIPISIKSKRFLGSMARGGWFPRQFRGFVAAENPYDKRHIGSAARMGYIPLTKSDRDDNVYFGEGAGFKRNIQSLKQNQFASPVNTWAWGKPRE